MAGHYPNLPSQNFVLEKVPGLSNDPFANAPEMAYGVPCCRKWLLCPL